MFNFPSADLCNSVVHDNWLLSGIVGTQDALALGNYEHVQDFELYLKS